MDILHLIDRLEGLITSGTRVPGFGKVMIDPDQMLDLIDQMRIATPKELHEARQLLKDRDAILSAAQREADEILAAARREVEAKLQTNDIVRLANDRANEITNAARADAERIVAEATAEAASQRREADEYNIAVLQRLLAQIDGVKANLQRYIDQTTVTTSPKS